MSCKPKEEGLREKECGAEKPSNIAPAKIMKHPSQVLV